MEIHHSGKLMVDRDLIPKFTEIYSFLQLFHGHLDIAPVGLADLDEFLEEGYDDYKSPVVQAHWLLLKGIGKRGDIYIWQSMAVKETFDEPSNVVDEPSKFAHAMGIIGEKTTYGELSKGKRLDILKSICDSQFDHNLKFKLEVNKLPTELLRLSPIGLDMDGNRHWFFQDHEGGLCLYSDGHYHQFPVQPSSCRDYCRTADELSHCIDQLEAEISDGSVCSRSGMCNGEASDGSGSHINDGVIGCLKCQKDNAYEQMLLCDQCNGECHMFCLYPPLHAVPSGTWLCPLCDQKLLVAKLKVLLFEAKAAELRFKTSKDRLRKKVDRLARSGVNCGNIIMSDAGDDDGLRRSHRSRAAVNYADLCDLDLTPIEECRKYKVHEKKLLTRAARYNILREKRGLTIDAESSSKESCYFSDHSNEMGGENCDRSSESNCEYEELHESIDEEEEETYPSDGDCDDTESPSTKKLKIIEDGLDQSSNADRTIETTEQYL